MAATIKASVGRKGKNQPEDVKTIQNLLNGFASKFGLPKLKVSGTSDAKLEQAIGKFQAEVCEIKADHRVDPGRNTFKKLIAGPAKAEAERKAKEKAFNDAVAKELQRGRAEVEKYALQVAKKNGFPPSYGKDLFHISTSPPFSGYFSTFINTDPDKTTLEKVKKDVDAGIKGAKSTVDNYLSVAVKNRDEVRAKIAAERDRILAAVRDAVRKKGKEHGMPVDLIEQTFSDVEKAIEKSIEKVFPGEKDLFDYTPKDVAALGEKVVKEGLNNAKLVMANVLKVRQMVLKTVAMQRNSTLARLKKVAEAQAKKAGLPLKSVEMLYGKYEKIAQEQFDKLAADDKELFGIDVKDVSKFADKVIAEVETGVKAIAAEAAKQRQGVEKNLVKQIKAKAKAMKLASDQVDEILGDISTFAEDQWDWLMGRSTGGDVAEVGKMAGDVAKEAASRMSDLLKEAEKRAREGESGEGAKVPLILRGSEEEKVNSACFKFSVAGKSPDPKSKVLLCLNKKDTHIDITKGYGKAQLIELFKLIDSKNLWGQSVNFFAMETTNGKPDDKTKSKVVSLKTPVAPFKGTISYTGIGADKTLNYPGNGKGRLLSYTKINGWYFFKYGGKYERDPAMRGFDCISYLGTANKASSGMDGRGDGLAAKLGAKKIDMEDVSHEKFVEFFNGDGKSGTYICWWKDHCFAVVNGSTHEFAGSKSGYYTGKATGYRYKGTKSVRKL